MVLTQLWFFAAELGKMGKVANCGLRDVVQSFGKIHYLVFIQDRGEGGGPGVLLGKLKYKIAFLYVTSSN